MTDYESTRINAATEKLIAYRDNLRAGKTFFVVGKDIGFLAFDYDGAKFVYSTDWKCDPYTMGLPTNGCSRAELNFCGIFYGNVAYILNQYTITREYIGGDGDGVTLPEGMEHLWNPIRAYNQYIRDQIMPDYINKTEYTPRSLENLEPEHIKIARRMEIDGESDNKSMTRNLTLEEGMKILLGVKTCEETAAEIYEEGKENIAVIKANMDARARYIAAYPVKEWERKLYLAFKELYADKAKTVNVTFERGGKTVEMKIDPGKAWAVVAGNETFSSYIFTGTYKGIEKTLKEICAYDYPRENLKPSEIVSVTYGRKTYYTKEA